MTVEPGLMPCRLVLASASPRRLDLLRQIGLEPALCLPTDLDETPVPREAPHALALRLARAKARVAGDRIAGDPAFSPGFLVAADTVVAVGRRILPKAETEAEARECLRLLSGRAHRVFTGLAVLASDGRMRDRLVETRVTMKRLSQVETEAYLAAGEWRGKAGGYAIQGRAAAFVTKISGSYSSVVGLPLFETMQLLTGMGFQSGGIDDRA
jgi:septum formation protein